MFCFVAFEFVISCLRFAATVGVAFVSRTYLVKHGCGGHLNILVLYRLYNKLQCHVRLIFLIVYTV